MTNQIRSLEENDIVNDNYKLNPSFSFAKVKPNDNSWDSNNEINNAIDDASTLTPFCLARKEIIEESTDDKAIIINVPENMQNAYKYINSVHQTVMANSKEIKHIVDNIKQLTNSQ